MTDPRTYPVRLTAVEPMRLGRTRDGRRYASFRARTEAAGRTAERTVRAFGAIAVDLQRAMRDGRTVRTRVAYDHFHGADGKRTQTMRVVSLT